MIALVGRIGQDWESLWDPKRIGEKAICFESGWIADCLSC